MTLSLPSQTRIWDAGAVALAGALGQPLCHLEALGLSHTQLTDVSAQAFSRAFACGKKTDRFTNVSIERTGDCLTEATPERSVRSSTGGCCTLRRLDLSGNGITDKGAR